MSLKGSIRGHSSYSKVSSGAAQTAPRTLRRRIASAAQTGNSGCTPRVGPFDRIGRGRRHTVPRSSYRPAQDEQGWRGCAKSPAGDGGQESNVFSWVALLEPPLASAPEQSRPSKDR